MNNVQTFDPSEVISESPAEHYEILFDTGKDVLQWTEEGFSEVVGIIHVQMQLRQEKTVEAYQRAVECAKTLLKPGVLHIVPVYSWR